MAPAIPPNPAPIMAIFEVVVMVGKSSLMAKRSLRFGPKMSNSSWCLILNFAGFLWDSLVKVIVDIVTISENS
ncbi:Uncharacterised protein [Chlamydia trachomatis]|nr:Uncharacterised protein [Chlamydia trachomatis]